MKPEDDCTPRHGAPPPHTLLDGSLVSRELPLTAWDAPHGTGGVHAHDAEEPAATKAKTCKPTRNPCCKP